MPYNSRNKLRMLNVSKIKISAVGILLKALRGSGEYPQKLQRDPCR